MAFDCSVSQVLLQQLLLLLSHFSRVRLCATPIDSGSQILVSIKIPWLLFKTESTSSFQLVGIRKVRKGKMGLRNLH